MPGNFHAVPQSVVEQWPAPNYVNPVRRSWLPILACTLLGFSTVLTGGRFYLRARKQAGSFGLDDIFIFVGWLVSIGLSTVAVLDSEWYGLDVHTWDVRPSQYVGAALTGWIAQILFLVSTCATKTSVLMFYRRMAKDSYSRKWLYAIWAALGFTAAYFIGVLVTYCLLCQPLNAYWLSYDFNYDKEFKCLNGNVLSPLVGALSIFSDLYAVLLPSVMLYHYNLDVPRRQKVLLNIIFALGTIVAGCGIARTYYLWRINHTFDTSWTGFDLFVWSLLECHLAIIFACAPSLRAFLRRYLGEPFRSNSRSTSRTKSEPINKESIPNASTLRDSSALSDPEKGRVETPSDQRILMKPSHDTLGALTGGTWTSRSQSSETVPRMASPDLLEVDKAKDAGYQKTIMSANTGNDTRNGTKKADLISNQRSWLDV